MRRWILERILSNLYDVQTVIGYRLPQMPRTSSSQHSPIGEMRTSSWQPRTEAGRSVPTRF
jgi:hypothetical protein